MGDKNNKKSGDKKTYSFTGLEIIKITDLERIDENLISSPFLAAYALIPGGDPLGGCGGGGAGDGGSDGGPPYC